MVMAMTHDAPIIGLDPNPLAMALSLQSALSFPSDTDPLAD
jgi:hypothetical protein